jgi:hypothetical protein
MNHMTEDGKTEREETDGQMFVAVLVLVGAIAAAVFFLAALGSCGGAW